MACAVGSGYSTVDREFVWKNDGGQNLGKAITARIEWRNGDGGDGATSREGENQGPGSQTRPGSAGKRNKQAARAANVGR